MVNQTSNLTCNGQIDQNTLNKALKIYSSWYHDTQKWSKIQSCKLATKSRGVFARNISWDVPAPNNSRILLVFRLSALLRLESSEDDNDNSGKWGLIGIPYPKNVPIPVVTVTRWGFCTSKYGVCFNFALQHGHDYKSFQQPSVISNTKPSHIVTGHDVGPLRREQGAITHGGQKVKHIPGKKGWDSALLRMSKCGNWCDNLRESKLWAKMMCQSKHFTYQTTQFCRKKSLVNASC